MSRWVLFFCLCLITFLIACKKEDTNQTPVIISEDVELKRISSYPWLIFKLEVSGTNFWNLPGVVQTCKKDDTYRFFRDSLLVTYDNSNKCSSQDSMVDTWKFFDNKKKVVATLFGITDTAEVISLQDSLMELSIDYMGSPAHVFFRKK